MNTHVKHYIFFSLGQVGKITGTIIATAILARYLDPAGLGRWTLIVAAATLFHSFFSNWLQQDPFLRFGKQEWVKSHTLEKTWSIRLPLLLTSLTLGAIVIFFLAPIYAPLFQFTPLERLIAFAFFISLVVTIDLQTALQIAGQMSRMALAPMLISLASIPLYLSLWLSDLPRYHVETSLLGTIVLMLIVWLSVGWNDLRKTKFGFHGWNVPGMTEFLHYAWPILPTAVLGYLMNWGNQVLIKQSFSNYEVGLYQSAFQVHSLLVTLAVPFTTIVLPQLIDKHLQDAGAMKQFAENIAPTLFCLWLLVLIPGVAVLPWIYIHIYGPTFTDGLIPLSALLIAAPFCAVGQLYTGLFTIQGRLGKVFLIILTMVSANFLLAWVLLPHNQITLKTISLAFSAAFILAQFLVYFTQHRYLRAPVGKITALFSVALIYSVIEFSFTSFMGRMSVSGVALAVLILVTRQQGLVDVRLLHKLFIGRLQGLGDMLVKILISERKVSA